MLALVVLRASWPSQARPGLIASALLLAVVQIVVDQISQVLGHVAIDGQRGQILWVAFQREHQQPHGCDGVGMHGVIAGRSLLRSRATR
jgi:hypothetical protein